MMMMMTMLSKAVHCSTSAKMKQFVLIFTSSHLFLKDSSSLVDTLRLKLEWVFFETPIATGQQQHDKNGPPSLCTTFDAHTKENHINNKTVADAAVDLQNKNKKQNKKQKPIVLLQHINCFFFVCDNLQISAHLCMAF